MGLPPHSTSIILAEGPRRRLRAHVVAVGGDVPAAATLGVGRSAIARALAGLPIRRATGTAIVRSLDALEGAERRLLPVDTGGGR